MALWSGRTAIDSKIGSLGENSNSAGYKNRKNDFGKVHKKGAYQGR
jgi:hypothetical protein